jgi:broad specificity phosphatase PhoE
VFPQLKGRIPWIALECVREETGLHPCDKRLSRTVKMEDEQFSHVDFSHIEFDDDPLYHRYLQCREPSEDVVQRAKDFFYWLQSRSEAEIIVVSHSAFLRHLFENVVYCDEFDKSMYKNCEIRSYKVFM